jgi:hypothetical protein
MDLELMAQNSEARRLQGSPFANIREWGPDPLASLIFWRLLSLTWPGIAN